MKTNTSKLTFAAVLAAAVIAFIYITTIVGTLQIVSAVISTFAVMLTMKTCGKKFAFAHYGAVAVLLFILLPNKLYALVYTLFFGLYAIAKFFIEKKNNVTVEWILKTIYFAVIAAILTAGLVFFASESIRTGGYLYIIVYFAAVAAMALYDVFLSVFGNQLFKMADKYLKNLK